MLSWVYDTAPYELGFLDYLPMSHYGIFGQPGGCTIAPYAGEKVRRCARGAGAEAMDLTGDMLGKRVKSNTNRGHRRAQAVGVEI